MEIATNQVYTVILKQPQSQVEVSLPQGVVVLPTFVRGDGRTCFRVSSSVPGVIRWQAAALEQSVQVRTPSEAAPLLQHGAVKVSADLKHLVHQDDTPFLWLADTWWYGATKRMRFPKPFQELTQDRVKKGFSVIQVVVGVPPEIEFWSEHAENEGGHPFLKQGETIGLNPSYFDVVDQRVDYLVDQGLVPCLVGNWGHHLEVVGQEVMLQFWKEMIARYAAYPVVFCLTGEVDLLPPLGYAGRKISFFKKVFQVFPPRVKMWLKNQVDSPQAPGWTLERRLDSWQEIGTYVAEHDPFHRLLIVHPQSKQTASQLFPQVSWINVETIQTGHDLNDRSIMVAAILHNYGKPFINLESWYERIQDKVRPSDIRYAFWSQLLSGAAGYSYGAQGVWNMANDDHFLGHWGESSWKEAVHFVGSKQVGKARQWLSEIAWQKLEPHFELLSPHWTADKVSEPVTATIDEQTLLAYFPIGHQAVSYQLQISGHGTVQLIWLSPSSLLKIHEETLEKNQESLEMVPPLSKEGDLLLVLRLVPQK